MASDKSNSSQNFVLNQKSALPVVLSIAGSDSGGCAGIQADLKTFSALGAFGTSAITAITCQNTRGVSAVQGVDPAIVGGQIQSVLEDFPVQAAKTGMLFSLEIIRVVRQIREEQAPDLPLIVDPVMVASSGEPLLQKEAQDELIAFLSCATYITPNIPEAEIILGHPIETISDMEAATQELHEYSGAIVLLKGGHRRTEHPSEPNACLDIYCDGSRQEMLSYPRLDTKSTHGTGCTLSAAIVAYLSKQATYYEATMAARAYLQEAIKHAAPLGAGLGPVHHLSHLWD